MKVKEIYFLKSARKVEQYPPYDYPEFAFFGKSNVGKSSLINMVMGKKNLVKTGQKPGMTQLINFFILNETISIVDLPGYGYAKAPKKVRQSFNTMLREYISSRENLKLAFLLMDIRRVPSSFEHEMIQLLHSNKIPVAITLTKTDKVSKGLKAKNTKIIIDELGVDKDSIFYTSAHNGDGKKDILRIIKDYS